MVFAQVFEPMESMLIIIEGRDYSCLPRFMCVKSFTTISSLEFFVIFLVLLHYLKWIDSSPSFFSKHRELLVANLTTSVFVHETVKLSDIIEGDLQPKEIDCLCEFI